MTKIVAAGVLLLNYTKKGCVAVNKFNKVLSLVLVAVLVLGLVSSALAMVLGG